MGNTTTTNNKKKKSNARKLIPAIGMLMTSAAMLTTSTYAWFTMNKEVSITGITLTASVPETLEISLGKDGGPVSISENKYRFTIPAPLNDGEEGYDETNKDWSNTVSILGSTGYYKGVELGTLVPVSSTDGANMYFTDDAIDDGTKLDANAEFYLEKAEFKSESEGLRYFIDIPVWFRTTAQAAGVNLETVDLYATATISDPDANTGNPLYKAARVSILNTDSDGNVSTQNGKTVPNNGIFMSSEASYNNNRSDTVTADQAVSDVNEKKAVWGAVDKIAANETVVAVPKRAKDSTDNHGSAKKMIVRIWLEGEDKACYNPNAGQSFSISLNFSQDAPTNQSGQNETP